jgi:hypothetical protein
MRLNTSTILLAVCLVCVGGSAADRRFILVKASITDIHEAMQAGTLTCHSLVQQHLDRIEAYDKQGPAGNAMLYVSPRALEQADAMDGDLSAPGSSSPSGGNHGSSGRMGVQRTMTLEEEKAIVDEAHGLGVKAACHTAGGVTLRDSIEVGCDSFELSVDIEPESTSSMSPSRNLTNFDRYAMHVSRGWTA